MKKLFLTSALVASSIISNSALAGFLIQAGIGARSDKYDIDDSVFNIPVYPEVKVTSADFNVGAGYAFETNSNFKPAIMVGYSIQTGENSDTQNVLRVNKYDVTVKDTSNFDVYGQLGYNLKSNLMLYANAGVSFMSFKTERTLSIRGITLAEKSDTNNVAALLLGLGAQHKFNENVAFFGELNVRAAKLSEEDEKVGAKINSFGLLIGARYYF